MIDRAQRVARLRLLLSTGFKHDENCDEATDIAAMKRKWWRLCTCNRAQLLRWLDELCALAAPSSAPATIGTLALMKSGGTVVAAIRAVLAQNHSAAYDLRNDIADILGDGAGPPAPAPATGEARFREAYSADTVPFPSSSGPAPRGRQPMTPNEFLAAFNAKTGGGIRACGGTGTLDWPSVLEIILFERTLILKGVSSRDAEARRMTIATAQTVSGDAVRREEEK